MTTGIDYGKMDPKLKVKWLEALRSGNYKQGITYLESIDNDGTRINCCLGVLCRIMKVPSHSDGTACAFTFPNNMTTAYSIPTGHAGIGSLAMDVCIAMNDKQRKTFPEIADWIEGHL